MDSRKKKLTQYVVPTILGNCAYFLFTIIDGIFVGQGVGTDALGAVNLVWPFVMVLNAIIMLTVVGGLRSQRCSAQTRPIISSCATTCSGIRSLRCRRG